MFEDKIKMIVCTTVFAIPLIFIGIQSIRMHQLNKQIETYKSQILALKVSSELDKKRFSIAEAQANIEVKESQKEVETVMKKEVPRKCSAAVAWGVTQARLIK